MVALGQQDGSAGSRDATSDSGVEMDRSVTGPVRSKVPDQSVLRKGKCFPLLR